MGRPLFYLPDEIKRAAQLTVADREADERVRRPVHGAQESLGYRFERAAQVSEVDLRAEIPCVPCPEAPQDLLTFRIKKSRIAGFREPRSFRDELVKRIAERFGYAHIEVVGVHVELREFFLKIGLEGAELKGGPVEQRPRSG
jgi:hypothetical protein